MSWTGVWDWVYTGSWFIEKQNVKQGQRPLAHTDTHFPGVLKCTDTGRQCDSAKASNPSKSRR